MSDDEYYEMRYKMDYALDCGEITEEEYLQELQNLNDEVEE